MYLCYPKRTTGNIRLENSFYMNGFTSFYLTYLSTIFLPLSRDYKCQKNFVNDRLLYYPMDHLITREIVIFSGSLNSPVSLLLFFGLPD